MQMLGSNVTVISGVSYTWSRLAIWTSSLSGGVARCISIGHATRVRRPGGAAYGEANLDRRIPPVHQVITPGDEGRLVGQEEADEGRDLLRPAEPPQRVPGDQRLPDLRRQVGEERGVDVGRAHAVDAQPQWPVFRDRKSGV